MCPRGSVRRGLRARSLAIAARKAQKLPEPLLVHLDAQLEEGALGRVVGTREVVIDEPGDDLPF